jgi:hypothetical protein
MAAREEFEWSRITRRIDANDETGAHARAELRRRCRRHRPCGLPNREKDDVGRHRCLRTRPFDVQQPPGSSRTESALDEQTRIACMQSGVHKREKIPTVLIEEIRQ